MCGSCSNPPVPPLMDLKHSNNCLHCLVRESRADGLCTNPLAALLLDLKHGNSPVCESEGNRYIQINIQKIWENNLIT